MASCQWELSRRFPEHFLANHATVYDAQSGAWVPFALWPAQQGTLADLQGHPLTVILKARQLGFTWLVVGYALHALLFRPAATVILFSRRDDEAVELLDFRLRGMHRRLPAYLRRRERSAAAHDWRLDNGSRAMAFPTTGGRSYTATLAVVDEADHVPDLNALLDAVKPTIDHGGRLVLLSTVDKSQPDSAFKRIYRAARAGANGYHPVFHGWPARPGRSEAWYAAQRADVLARTGALDDLHQEYPATDAEALAPRSLDKRISPDWLTACYQERAPLAALPPEAPPLPGLVVWRPPLPGRVYVAGADPAEGNPTSDESALCVLDGWTGEQMAVLGGRLEPEAFARAADALCRWYNDAAVMVERNNHGHAVLLWLRTFSGVRRLPGHDRKEGWLSSRQGKALLYDAAAQAARDGSLTLYDFATLTQLQSIEGNSLQAPAGQPDDRADACALALAVLVYARSGLPRPKLEPTVLTP